jgi:hypothetical protein
VGPARQWLEEGGAVTIREGVVNGRGLLLELGRFASPRPFQLFLFLFPFSFSIFFLLFVKTTPNQFLKPL